MYDLAGKVLFVHIPKTAGSSISNALFGRKDFHRTADQYREILSLEGSILLDDLYSFSFVRNPWDRMVSYYMMCRDYKDRSVPIGRIHKFVDSEFGEYSFPSFLAYVQLAHFRSIPEDLDNAARLDLEKSDTVIASLSQEVFPQTYWLSLDGSIVMDFIGKWENLEDDFNELCLRIGRKSPCTLGHNMPCINGRGSYSEYYDSYNRDLVGALFKSDIEEFGYDY